ncbi:MAG: hypothetical protein ACRDD1_09845, partial [Planctomycetia bacterium]
CNSRKWKRVDGSETSWLVTCLFDSKGDEEKEEENPEDRTPDVEHGCAEFTRAFDREVNEDGSPGGPVLNGAGQPFGAPAEIDDSRPVLVIERNEPNFTVKLQLEYKDAVNDDQFYGEEPGCWKMKCPTARLVKEGELRYHRVRYEIHHNENKWFKEILDQGLYKKSGNTLEPIKDKDGQAVTEPVNMKDGDKLPDGETHFIKFKAYKRKPFRKLRLEV